MASDSKKSRTNTPSINRQIDENLKRAFEADLDEELPDRFKELISKLKQKDEAGRK